MTLAVLYNYMNCTVDKRLAMALALVTDYITNCSIIIRIFGYSLLASAANLCFENRPISGTNIAN